MQEVSLFACLGSSPADRFDFDQGSAGISPPGKMVIRSNHRQVSHCSKLVGRNVVRLPRLQHAPFGPCYSGPCMRKGMRNAELMRIMIEILLYLVLVGMHINISFYQCEGSG